MSFMGEDDVDYEALEALSRRPLMSRRTVLPEISIEGSPDGTGTETMAEGDGQVIETPLKAPGTPVQDANSAPYSQLLGDLYRATASGDAGSRERLGGTSRPGDVDAPSAFDTRIRRDLQDTIAGSTEGTHGQAPSRGDAFGGSAAQAMTLGHLDEIGAGLSGRPIEQVRSQLEGANERFPNAAMAGTVAGVAMSAPFIPAPARGAGLAARLGTGAIQGAGLGAIAAHGESRGATASERLAEMPGGALAGGAMGLAGGAAGEAIGSGMRGLSRLGRGADRARVASLAGGGTLSPSLMREAERASGGLPAVAERIRRQRLVSPLASADDISDASEAALQRTDLPRYWRAMDELLGEPSSGGHRGGGGIPRQRIVDALVAYGNEVKSNPNMRRAAEPVFQRAYDYSEALPPRVSYSQAEQVLRELGDQANWGTALVRPPEEVMQGSYRALRGTLDRVVDEAAGPQLAREFRDARLDAQTALMAREAASDTLASQSRRPGYGLIDMLATSAGAATGGAASGGLAGAAGGLAGFAASRAARRLGQAPARAVMAEMAQRASGPTGQAIASGAQSAARGAGVLASGGAGAATADEPQQAETEDLESLPIVTFDDEGAPLAEDAALPDDWESLPIVSFDEEEEP